MPILPPPPPPSCPQKAEQVPSEEETSLLWDVDSLTVDKAGRECPKYQINTALTGPAGAEVAIPRAFWLEVIKHPESSKPNIARERESLQFYDLQF